MSKSIIKPKATLLWSEQTEKLKQKLFALTGLDIYFQQVKMELVMQRIHDKMRSSKTEFEIITKL